VWVLVVAPGAVAAVIGCGSESNAPSSNELVRYEVAAGELGFELGEPQDSVITIPRIRLVVRDDATATYVIGDQPEVDFKVDGRSFSRIQEQLEAIDFAEARRQLDSEQEHGAPVITVAHRGATVELGDKFFGAYDGRGPRMAGRVSYLVDELERVARRSPEARKAVDTEAEEG
jgi:hypothetical protein